jgi:hypothetical protein
MGVAFLISSIDTAELVIRFQNNGIASTAHKQIGRPALHGKSQESSRAVGRRWTELSLDDHQRDVVVGFLVAEEFADRVLDGHHQVAGDQSRTFANQRFQLAAAEDRVLGIL